jgi:hypothetical protein
MAAAMRLMKTMQSTDSPRPRPKRPGPCARVRFVGGKEKRGTNENANAERRQHGVSPARRSAYVRRAAGGEDETRCALSPTATRARCAPRSARELSFAARGYSAAAGRWPPINANPAW